MRLGDNTFLRLLEIICGLVCAFIDYNVNFTSCIFQFALLQNFNDFTEKFGIGSNDIISINLSC